MTFRTQWWLWIPLAAALGCAGSQQSQQKVTQAGGNSTLVDEGPASASAAGAAGAAAAQPANAQLVPFEGANGFTVLMPPNPEKNQRTQETPGGPVQVHIAQAQDASGKYLSSLSEFPKGSLAKVKSKDLLDSLQQATVQSMGGTLVKSEDIQVGGLAGREFTATDPQGSEVTARVFVGDSRVYTLAGTYPQGQMPGSIQQFLGSFQPPAGAAVGGSGAPDAAGGSAASDLNNSGSDRATGESVSGSSSDSVSTVPAEPQKKSKKKARGSTGSTSAGSAAADTVSGSR
ncbi:MAG TPA: hypothetical protein VFD38_16655 [Myxococcaceae bacterium]|nr:hypothetical protein [Myxococcaceae bacterium]